MANDGEFQAKIRQLATLITEFDQLPESAAKAAGRELIQMLMELHGTGLERVMEVAFDSGGEKTVRKLGDDSTAGSLLLLYSLHPDDLDTRIGRALDRLRPRLRKSLCSIELLGIQEGQVELRISGHGHIASPEEVRAVVEDGIFEYAPDVASLTIRGLEQTSGFVALETLTGPKAPVAMTTGAPAAAD